MAVLGDRDFKEVTKAPNAATHSRLGRFRKARFSGSFPAQLRKREGVIAAAHLELGM